MGDNDNTMKEWRQNIITQISKARIAKGLSQAQLAELLQTHRSNISRLESGGHNPSLDFLLRVASVLDMEFDLKPYRKEHSEHMENTYELRLYDTMLLAFTLEERGIEGLVAKIITVNEDKQKLFPLELSLTSEGIVKWLEERIIPKNRAFVDEILKSLNLSLGNTKGIIDVCKGLSLNDSYWIVPQGFDGAFAQYNLYRNRFSEILSLIAYTGIWRSHGAFSTSPELTTSGILPKAWRLIEGDGIYLYKGGSSGAANTGQEPYSEYYACQIAQAMGLNAVTYDLENWKGILASKCKLFTDINTSYIPIGRIVRKGGLKACLDYYGELDKDKSRGVRGQFVENMRSMLVFDAVVYNADRHFGNFGVLRDNPSGGIISTAPLFDHGVSLFNYAVMGDFDDLDAYAKTRYPAYANTTFESICSDVMGRTQAQQLRRLIGFKFMRHPVINWPEKRLVAIERHTQKRVRQLLD